jgi:hypothetical protein
MENLMERDISGPPQRIYDVAKKALEDWTYEQDDPDNLWENVDESSKAVVDAIWPYVTTL